MAAPRDPLPNARPIAESLDDWMTLREASDFFNGRSISTVKADCEFLGIDTTRQVSGGSLSRQDMYILYVFYFWRRTSPRVKKTRYWADVSFKEDIPKGQKASVKTAQDQLRLSYMKMGGGSHADFTKAYNRAIEKRNDYKSAVAIGFDFAFA